MKHPFGGRTVPLCLTVAAVAGACAMDIAEPNTKSAPPEFIGTYDLVSLNFSNEHPITPPSVTGMLVLTPNTYKVTVHLQSPDSTATDSGTYTISGNHWTQISAGFPLRTEGTADIAHDTLTVDLATASVQVTNVWKKRAQAGQ